MLIIVIILLVISLAILGYYRNQIRGLANQMRQIRQGNHNQLLTQEVFTRELNDLVEEVNHTIVLERELRIQNVRKSQQHQQLLTNLSHDVRTPLTSLIGYLQLLELSDDPLDQERYLGIINERARTLKRLLDELFLLSRLEDTNYQPELNQVNLTTLTRQSILSFYDEFEQQSFDVVIEIPEEALLIQGNEELLERIITNLLTNVTNHGSERLVVKLMPDIDSSYVKLSLANPISIDTQLDPQFLTQRYISRAQIDGSENSGLGLNIVKAALIKMDAELEIKIEDNNFVVEMKFKKY